VAESSKERDKAITKRDICNSIHASCRRLSRKTVQELFEADVEEIKSELVKGESVKLRNFGVFSVRSKKERMGRNPKTGEQAIITKRRVVTFRPSDAMKRRIETELRLD
jgi:integration host factor subunit alpha